MSGLRASVLEWASRHADGLDGLDWVADDLDAAALDYEARGDGTFHAVSLARFLPPAMAEAAAAAGARGEATAIDGVQAILARVTWLVASRRLWWTASSPAPALLATLVEAWGIPRDLHGDDPDRLRALVVRLAAWRPVRGALRPTLALLADALEEVPAERYADVAVAEQLRDEVFACHDASWWAARAAPDAAPAYRIDEGYLRFQPADRPGFPLLREDVLVDAADDRPWSTAVARLLPAWAVPRPVLRRNAP